MTARTCLDLIPFLLKRSSVVLTASSLALVACGSKAEPPKSKSEPEPQPSTYAQKVLGALDRTAIEKTRQDMLAVNVAIHGFSAATGSIPDATSYDALAPMLTPNQIRRLPPTDAWGSKFVYQTTPSGGFTLTAPGEDGQVGTGDDIVLEEGGFTKLPDNYRPVM